MSLSQPMTHELVMPEGRNGFERRIDPGEFRAIALALGVDPAVEFKDVSDRLSRSWRR